MPTRRTPRHRQARAHVNQAAVDAWRAADMWGLHRALGLAPWELSPLPYAFTAYGLTDKPPANPSTCMEQSWPKAKALQDELYAVAGEPGSNAEEADA